MPGNGKDKFKFKNKDIYNENSIKKVANTLLGGFFWRVFGLCLFLTNLVVDPDPDSATPTEATLNYSARK